MADPGALLEPLIPALRRYAYALLRNHAAADDLVQDTLERALSHWTSRRPDGELRAWLFSILRNLHIDAYRQARRRGTEVEIDEVDHRETATRQEAALEARDVLAALEQLPEEQKSLLLLIGVEDFSYDEAARILGVPIGTVMSRLSRARQRLRSIVERGPVALLRRVK
jgi:RNA polymerase sigma-70 factor (ECF subfamily)